MFLCSQVLIVQLPELDGVHAKTFSGELLETGSQLPENALEPEVTPVKVPPCGGITVSNGLSHGPGTVEVVVEVLVVEVVVEVLVVRSWWSWSSSAESRSG